MGPSVEVGRESSVVGSDRPGNGLLVYNPGANVHSRSPAYGP